MNFLFTSKRLGFRKFKESDYSTFCSINKDKDVMEFFVEPLSDSQSIDIANFVNSEIEQNGFGFFAVEVLETNQFIGFLGLHKTGYETEFTPCIEIGWRFAKEVWGKGYATEGAKACLDYGFNKLNLSEVVSFTTHNNVRSEKVMRNIRMQHIGFFNHPKVPKGHLLEKHTLYKIKKENFNER